MDAADADDDGEVALRDALYVLHAEHGTVQLPPPYPEPGVDPTEDGLDCGQYPGVAAPPEDGPYYYGTKWQALGAKQKGKG
jgi:hypothetical protein